MTEVYFITTSLKHSKLRGKLPGAQESVLQGTRYDTLNFQYTYTLKNGEQRAVKNGQEELTPQIIISARDAIRRIQNFLKMTAICSKTL